MEYDTKKVDELVLALMTLNTFDDGQTTRAWIRFDESLERLQQQNYIRHSTPQAKSVLITAEGRARAQEYFKKHILEDNG